MALHSVNTEQRLYVIRHGNVGGFTCYGFDVLDRKARKVRAWRTGHYTPASQPLASPLGTAEHFAEAMAELDKGHEHHQRTGLRCPAELEPRLIGLEGRRVEVTTADGERSRFWVGKSTGWMPCHLEIKTRRSSGGCPVYLPETATVRVVAQRH